MEFDIDRDALGRLVGAAERIVSARATHPVLGGLKVALTGAKLTVAATDLEQSLVVSDDLDGMASSDGAVVVPGKLFAGVVKALPAGRVEVAIKGNELLVRRGRTEVTLATLALDDFPAFDGLGASPSTATMKGTTLAAAIKRVAVAASTDEVRPVLTGVLWNHDGETLRLVATDSYRLALEDLETGPSQEREAVVPGAFLRELARLLTEADVTLQFGDSQVRAEGAGFQLSSRLIEGEYPKYRQLVPEGYPSKLVANREALAIAVGQVKVVAGARTPVKLHLGDEVTLTAVEAGVGESSTVLEDADYQGEPMVVAFNPQFLGDALAVMVGETVTLEVSSSTKPGLLREAEGSYRHVVMPVRLSR